MRRTGKRRRGHDGVALARLGYLLSGCYGSDRGLFLLGADAGAGAGQVDGLGPGSAGQDGRDRAKDGHAG